MKEFVAGVNDGRLVLVTSGGEYEYFGKVYGCRVQSAEAYADEQICAVVLEPAGPWRKAGFSSNGVGVRHDGSVAWSVDLSSFPHEEESTWWFNDMEPSPDRSSVFFYTPYGWVYGVALADGHVIGRQFTK